MQPLLPTISKNDPYYKPENIHLSRLNSLVNGVAIAIFILCPPLYLLERAADWITIQFIQNLFLPAIGKAVNSHLTGFICSNPSASVQTPDGVTLNGYQSIFDEATPPQDQKWVISFSGNNMVFNHSNIKLNPFRNYRINMLFMNYRGISYSEGFPKSAEDLYRDGSAIVASLLDKGVQAENILLHGFCFGGGVAAAVTAKYHEAKKMIRCIHDRSFKSFYDVAINILHRTLNNVSKNLKEASPSILAIISCIAFAALILIAISSPFLLLIAPFLTYKLSQLNIDATAALTHIDPRFFRVIYHKNDPVIPHPSCSLAGYLEGKNMGIEVCEIDEPLFYTSPKIVESAGDFLTIGDEGKPVRHMHMGDLLGCTKGKNFFQKAIQELLFQRARA